jgi:hypothetical protein
MNPKSYYLLGMVGLLLLILVTVLTVFLSSPKAEPYDQNIVEKMDSSSSDSSSSDSSSLLWLWILLGLFILIGSGFILVKLKRQPKNQLEQTKLELQEIRMKRERLQQSQQSQNTIKEIIAQGEKELQEEIAKIRKQQQYLHTTNLYNAILGNIGGGGESELKVAYRSNPIKIKQLMNNADKQGLFKNANTNKTKMLDDLCKSVFLFDRENKDTCFIALFFMMLVYDCPDPNNRFEKIRVWFSNNKTKKPQGLEGYASEIYVYISDNLKDKSFEKILNSCIQNNIIKVITYLAGNNTVSFGNRTSIAQILRQNIDIYGKNDDGQNILQNNYKELLKENSIDDKYIYHYFIESISFYKRH